MGAFTCGDLAREELLALGNRLPEHLHNDGTSIDVVIKKLSETIQKTVGHKGTINWDSTKPDGAPRKLMNVSKLNNLGWKSEIDLEKGIESTYGWFLRMWEVLRNLN